MEWQAVLQSTLGASLGTVLVQLFAPWWRERCTRHSHAAYLALRLAVGFEEFGAACSERNSDNANAYHSPDDEYPAWNIHLPERAPVPEDAAGWLALCAANNTLADRALTFQSRIASAMSAIAHCIEFYGDDLDLVMPIQISECGLEANRLAQDLRRTFNLAPSDPTQAWPDYLDVALKQAREKYQARRKRNRLTAKIDDADQARSPSPPASATLDQACQ